MTWTDAALLNAAANRASRRAGFLGYDLAAYEKLTGDDPRHLLKIDDLRLHRLALCRTPRRGARFGDDVLAIAAHVDVAAITLAKVLRLTDALIKLRGVEGSTQDHTGHSAPVLAAARDDGLEHTVLTSAAGAAAGLPGWLQAAVQRFWSHAPTGERFPRDLDFAVLVGLPLALVELPRLSVKTISDWIGKRQIDFDLSRDRDRRLRACLVALGGVGLIFVDTTDDATQRRVSLAHEAAHFIVEYLLPRDDVARRRPELLDVIDGRRPATTRERLSAVLGDVPIGVHTHLVDRAPTDHARSVRIDEAEWRARRVALELLAPQPVIMERIRGSQLRQVEEVRTLLVAEFGLPVSLADDYADQLLGLAAPARPGLLDLLDESHQVGGEKGATLPPGRTRHEAHEHDRTPNSDPEVER